MKRNENKSKKCIETQSAYFSLTSRLSNSELSQE